MNLITPLRDRPATRPGAVASGPRQRLLARAERLSPVAGGAGESALSGMHLAVIRGAGAALGRRSSLLGEAATSLGARVAQLPLVDIGQDSAARLLGRLYRALACEGLDAAEVSHLQAWSGLPVVADLASPDHPDRLLADVLVVREVARELNGVRSSGCRLGLRTTTLSVWHDAWRRASEGSAFELVALGTASARDLEVDLLWDPDERGEDGRPLLWQTDRTHQDAVIRRSLAARQYRLHGQLVQALLLEALE